MDGLLEVALGACYGLVGHFCLHELPLIHLTTPLTPQNHFLIKKNHLSNWSACGTDIISIAHTLSKAHDSLTK